MDEKTRKVLSKMEKHKISRTQFVLTTIYAFMLLISNIIVVKEFRLPFGLTATGAIITFPITYILSDVFSEVYGYKWSRYTCHIAFAMNCVMALLFQIVIWLPSADGWTNQNALVSILGNAPRILLGSFVALEVGDFVNDVVFKKLKSKHEGLEGFGFRAIFSSVCGNFIDSITFGLIALTGYMSIKDIVIMALTESVMKTIYEIIIYPITKTVVKATLKAENGSCTETVKPD